MRILAFILFMIGFHNTSKSQVLISILLGDQLNSGKVEFGLDGGLTLSEVAGLPESKFRHSLNLGFYFDIKTKHPDWLVHTGVIVKSTLGAKDLPVYSLNDANLDIAFQEGHITRRLNYFNVPIMMKYKWTKTFYVEGGPMFSLLSKCTDEFLTTVDKKEDLSYKLNIRDQFHPVDAGVIVGVGYRLMGGNGMNTGIRYYHGLSDITIDDSTPDQFNRAIYFTVGIPIGAGKKTADKKE